MSWLEGTRARLRLLFGRGAAEARMDQEFYFHIDMEARRLEREQGLSLEEARRRAYVAFGGVDRHREAMRDGRGLAWLGGLTLDLRLAARMLVKYPGLTVVGGLAMAFAICVGAILFEMLMLFVSPALPLPGGDRLVYRRTWDVQTNKADPRALHDFVAWRQAMRSVTDLGAWQEGARNLEGRDGEVRPVTAASITASAFRVAATPPLLGRALVPADEAAGAPPVVVLGHDVWRARFDGDSAIVGRNVRFGGEYATVVGVMPAGFAFPLAHEAWTALRADALEAPPRRGPGITIFGRLAPGATLDDARAELSVLGQRAARERPETHEHLQPQVMPYAKMFGGAPTGGEMVAVMTLIQVFVLMLLVLVCGNVALLLFARAATRESEIIVRSALGASRRRIVVQLFAEALVLGGVAAAVGLLVAHVALRQVGRPFLEANFATVPFWVDPRLSPGTVLYACVLTLVAAAIVGVVPGLKITRGIGSRLRAGTSGGGGVRFGGVWTAVIVAQVAVTVAFPAIALLEARSLNRLRTHDVGFAADRYLAVRLEVEAAPGADPSTGAGQAVAGDSAAVAADRARLGRLVETLRQRVAAEPGVAGVTFADRLPRDNYDYHDIVLEDSAAIAAAGARSGKGAYPWTKIAYVDPSYFDVLGAPILAGRGLQPADLAPGSRVAVADQGFVDRVLLGRDPIGQRFRLGESPIADREADTRPYYESVGLVKDLGMVGAAESIRGFGVYLPAAAGRDFQPYMLIHTRGDPLAFVPRARALAAALDPTLRLSELRRLDRVADDLVWLLGMWLRATLVLTGVALLLSLAGIYAVLAFTVARRTREIGVRVALGASQRGVLTAIFRRPLTQVGAGIAVGATLIYFGAQVLSRTTQYRDAPIALSPGQVVLLVVYAAFMLGVCLLACVVPTRRALRVEPTVALRAE